jgi:hypothetical protein
MMRVNDPGRGGGHLGNRIAGTQRDSGSNGANHGENLAPGRAANLDIRTLQAHSIRTLGQTHAVIHRGFLQIFGSPSSLSLSPSDNKQIIHRT